MLCRRSSPARSNPKLLALLLDDKLLGVVAAGFTPFVLPNLAALLGVSIPTQLAIFRPPFLWNTFTASMWMTGQFLVYYCMIAMFASWLQKDLKLSPGDVALPNILHNAIVFFAMGFWGFVGDDIGRRLAIIIPAALSLRIISTPRISPGSRSGSRFRGPLRGPSTACSRPI